MRNLCVLMFCVMAMIFFSFAVAGEQIPAFPGAEGFGAFTKGGRGGQVIQVTTLQDYHPKNDKVIPGSLRAACEEKGPRIIVFRVAGNIDLKAPLRITEPFCTIAGQTAPGDGICIRGDDLSISTSDVVVRYLRARCGPGREYGVDNHGISTRRCNNVILDHCSITWGVDETVSIVGGSDMTVQWCIVAEGLNISTHAEGAHSKGFFVSGGATRVTIHHNLLAHNSDRNPYLQTPSREGQDLIVNDVRNNVVYNSSAANASGRFNFIGNLYIPGQNFREMYCLRITAPAEVFVYDNIGPMRSSNDMPQANAVRGVAKLVEKPFEMPEVTTHPVSKVLSLVLMNVGATLPKRDSADQRLVADVEQHRGKIINDPQQVGGWPVLQSAEPYPDSNNNGMPDEWEKRYGLDPNDPTVGNRDPDGDGYTNIEEYLNGTVPTTP